MNVLENKPPGLYWQSRMGNNQDGIGGNCHRYEIITNETNNTELTQSSKTSFVVDFGIKMTNGMSGEACQFPSPRNFFVRHGETVLEDGQNAPSALLLTHAHEDHLGAIKYAIDMGYDIPPVKCSAFTAQILAKSLTNAGIAHDKWPEISVIDPHQNISIGAAKIEFVPVDHMPGSCGLYIQSQEGNIFHTGDYKFDSTLPLGPRSNPERLKNIGQEGVDLIVSDSTSTENKTKKIFEKEIESSLTAIVRDNKDKAIIVGVLGTQLDRLASLAKAAVANDRVVIVVGRSLENNVVALKLSGIDIEKETGAKVLRPFEAKGIAADRAIVVTTGAFAQPYAGLTRIADRQAGALYIDKDTTIIIPQHAIPPVRNYVERMVAKLEDKGAKVITAEISEKLGYGAIHQTGHAIEADTKLLYSLLKPKLLIAPIHGNEKQLNANATIARSLGVETLALNQNGTVMRLHNHKIEKFSEEKSERIGAIHTGENKTLPRAKNIAERRDGPVPIYRYQTIPDVITTNAKFYQQASQFFQGR